MNIKANIEARVSSGLLQVNSQKIDRGLLTPSKQEDTPQQKHDLLSFFIIGSKEFDNYIQYFILKEAGVNAPQCKKRLTTFAVKKTSKSRVNQLKRD